MASPLGKQYFLHHSCECVCVCKLALESGIGGHSFLPNVAEKEADGSATQKETLWYMVGR